MPHEQDKSNESVVCRYFDTPIRTNKNTTVTNLDSWKNEHKNVAYNEHSVWRELNQGEYKQNVYGTSK